MCPMMPSIAMERMIVRLWGTNQRTNRMNNIKMGLSRD